MVNNTAAGLLIAVAAMAVSAGAAHADLAADKQTCSQSNYDQIIPACTRVIEATKDVSRTELTNAYYYRANEYIRTSEWDKAEADGMKCLAANARDVGCMAQVGRAYSGRGNHVTAAEYFENAVKIDPKYVYGWANVGYELNAQGLYEKAIDAYDHALILDPKYSWGFASRGDSYSSLEKYEQALGDYQTAYLIDPQYSYAMGGAAYCYRKLKKFAEAEAEISKALAVNSSYDYGVALRGLLAFDQGKFDLAKASLDQAITMNANQSWYFAYRGMAATMLKQRDLAKADLDKALEMSPGYIEANFFLGLWHKQGGNKAEALNAFRASLKETASTAEARAAQKKSLKHIKELEG